LQRSMPDTHFFAPDGAESCDMGPFGYQWFSLKDRRPDILQKELARTMPSIKSMIENKAKELGLEVKDVILLGFSQGTMASLYLALSAGIDFKAIVGFSGALIKPNEPIASKTPICLIHGDQDDVVPHGSLTSAARALQEMNMEVETLSIPYLAHSIDMKGLKKAIEFIGS